MTLVITGRMAIEPEALPELLAAASAMATQTRAEPGCVAYRFGTDVDDTQVVHLFEEWDGSDALDAHFATPHFQTFSEVLLRSVAGDAEFHRYEVASKAPLFG